jgi:hypothetical protein
MNTSSVKILEAVLQELSARFVKAAITFDYLGLLLYDANKPLGYGPA